MATKQSKRTTLADLMAAAKVGAIDPATEVVTARDAAKQAAAAVQEADQSRGIVAIPAPEPRSGTEHECAIPGCKHGASHPLVSQPDRQVKLQCPSCGAVARMTSSAIAKSVAHGGGIRCGADGETFNVSTRRTYSPRAK